MTHGSEHDTIVAPNFFMVISMKETKGLNQRSFYSSDGGSHWSILRVYVGFEYGKEVTLSRIDAIFALKIAGVLGM